MPAQRKPSRKSKRNYKKEYAEFQGSPKQRAYRAALNREARKRKIYGKRKGMKKDLSHSITKSGKRVFTLENSSKNRARNASAKRKTGTTKRKLNY
jgi:hypothetical protein